MSTNGSLLARSWDLVHGFKATFWLAMLYAFCIFLAMAIITFPIYLLGTKAGIPHPIEFLMTILIGYFTLPAGLGIFLLALHHAKNEPIKASEIFSCYHLTIMGQVFLLTLLFFIVMLLLALIPSWIVRSLFILILIYFTTIWTFSAMLVADKKIIFISAIGQSIQAVSRHLFKIIGVYIFMGVLVFLSFCTLLIGFIWSAPLMINMGAMMYQDFFGEPQHG